MTTFEMFEIGGFIRDNLLGIPSKDRDLTVVIHHDQPLTVDEAFSLMRDHLESEGHEIFVESPEHGTIRAKPPAKGELVSDFVLARRDGPYSDGRRPDFVEVGTLEDDLARRDFSVNALARPVDSDEIIDLHGGLEDLNNRVLRFVGKPMDRIIEDALRVLRALRFAVTKGFRLHESTLVAINDPRVPDLLCSVSDDRIRDELHTMFFQAHTVEVLDLLTHAVRPELLDAMFAGDVRLTSTMKKGSR